MKAINLVGLLFTSISALPTGCGINETVIAAGMGAQTKLGYTITPHQNTDGSFTFSVGNTLNRADFQGILMYVSPSTNAKMHLGKFMNLDSKKFKYQNSTVCNSQKIIGDVAATITHANGNRAPLSTNWNWMGNSTEMAMTNLVIKVVVASLNPGATGKAMWEHLADIPLSTSGSSSGGSVSTMPASQQTSVQAAGFIGPPNALLALAGGLAVLAV
ncbi:hypothetical protein HDV01_000390 [Terramyces sp. JEL0728]|nr:hypothetical protein HDV01_000390 [Terramyces sp. JEL0728]